MADNHSDLFVIGNVPGGASLAHRLMPSGKRAKVYGTALLRLRERDRGELLHADGGSPAWPLRYEDFAPWHDEVERLLPVHVHGQRGEDPNEPPWRLPVPHPAVPHQLLGGTAHQAGTARFGADPASSVLDLHCKAHEFDNLYIADGSFFVSTGAVNPTLTLVANGLRVAAHIGDRFGVPRT